MAGRSFRLSAAVVKTAFGTILVFFLFVNLILWRNHTIDVADLLHNVEQQFESGLLHQPVETAKPQVISVPVAFQMPPVVHDSGRSVSSSDLSTETTTGTGTGTNDVYQRSADPIDTKLEDIPTLPSFSNDRSEFVFGSLIERMMDAWDLHVTTMFLCHFMLEPTTNPLKQVRIHPAMKEEWHKAVGAFRDSAVRYSPSGIRLQETVQERYYCRIRHSPSSQPYTVQGVFMPNKLTVDNNANQRMDILRCPVQNAQEAYALFATGTTTTHMSVDILRYNQTLISFTIPWAQRKTGYLLTTPPSASSR